MMYFIPVAIFAMFGAAFVLTLLHDRLERCGKLVYFGVGTIAFIVIALVTIVVRATQSTIPMP